MVKAIDPLKEFSEVHPDDLELQETDRTIWSYTGLGLRAVEMLQNLQTALVEGAGNQPDSVAYRSGSIELTRLKFGMRPPKGFETAWAEEPAGAQFPKKFVPTDAYLDTIPKHVRAWLADLIGAASRVSEEDAEKSSPPSTSSSTKDSSPTATTADAPSS